MEKNRLGCALHNHPFIWVGTWPTAKLIISCLSLTNPVPHPSPAKIFTRAKQQTHNLLRVVSKLPLFGILFYRSERLICCNLHLCTGFFRNFNNEVENTIPQMKWNIMPRGDLHHKQHFFYNMTKWNVKEYSILVSSLVHKSVGSDLLNNLTFRNSNTNN